MDKLDGWLKGEGGQGSLINIPITDLVNESCGIGSSAIEKIDKFKIPGSKR